MSRFQVTFNDFKDIFNSDDFEEYPVDIETFVQSNDYLGLPPLSEYQYIMIRAATQIYKRDTLYELYDEEQAELRWSQTCNEVIYKLGKGSGKDYSSTIACSYVVYLLLCLKDPARYYNKPPGDTIDIINVAINAAQANNVFFKGFKNRVEKSPWFRGKYVTKTGQIEFDKNITVYSGHSERESFEGYNTIFVVLDEISGFAIDSNTGNENAKTAEAIYDMYTHSVTSRFPDYGKVVLLSFPRYKGCFISQRYDKVVAEKEVIVKTHKFKIDPDLPDGEEGNEFEISWNEDHIVAYNYPRVFALCRPTWDVNPTRTIDDFKIAFLNNVVEALSRYACMPPDAIDAFFKDKNKIEQAFSGWNGVDEENGWVFKEWFKPQSEETKYFIHVDLAKKQDNCAVALAHVEKFIMRKIGASDAEILPVVKVDAIRWWKPTADKNVDFADVRDYIVSLQQRGFNLSLVTFDRWRSDDLINYLISIGIKAEVLSLHKRHYGDFAIVMHDDRLHGPDIELLKTEMSELRIMPNDKIDHPRKGSKDLTDAVCGAIYNAVAYTPRTIDHVVEISTYTTLKEHERNSIPNNDSAADNGVIRAPKREMPVELSNWLESMGVL